MVDEEPEAPHPLPPAVPDPVCFTMPVFISEFPTNSDANNTRLVSQFPMQNFLLIKMCRQIYPVE